MRKAFGNKLLRSHFYNFCSTDYLGHAIHRTSMGFACICSYRNCGCNGIFPPVNNHYCARWASLHMHIYIYKKPPTPHNHQTSTTRSIWSLWIFKLSYSALQLLLLTALMTNLACFLLVSMYPQNAMVSICMSKVCYLMDRKGKNRQES